MHHSGAQILSTNARDLQGLAAIRLHAGGQHSAPVNINAAERSPPIVLTVLRRLASLLPSDVRDRLTRNVGQIELSGGPAVLDAQTLRPTLASLLGIPSLHLVLIEQVLPSPQRSPPNPPIP